MGTLIFVCPTTGHQVSTGVEVDRSSYKRLPRTKTAIFCPRCHRNHLLSRIWAWLDSNEPKVVEYRPRGLGFDRGVWCGGQKMGADETKSGQFVTSRASIAMPSRRKPKPSVKSKECAEPRFGSRKRDGPRKPRKPQARKMPDRPSRRAASRQSPIKAGA
jgi:hypothetical protein